MENEALFLRRATALGIPVTAAEVVHDRTGRSGLLVTRFDRRPGSDGRLERIGVEDATQLLGRYPADKYTVSTEEVTEVIAKVCASAPLARRAVLLQVVFAWATGNGGLHGKNLSVIHDGTDWNPSPVYDLPSTLPYGDTTMALPIGGRRDGFSGRTMLEFSEAVGLPEKAARRVLATVREAVDGVESGTREIPLDPQRARTPEAPRHALRREFGSLSGADQAQRSR